jgi:hypothetical protein
MTTCEEKAKRTTNGISIRYFCWSYSTLFVREKECLHVPVLWPKCARVDEGWMKTGYKM